ncbi:MAG: hypothetical protein R2939_18990 [Kofleriaceae bacterium]
MSFDALTTMSPADSTRISFLAESRTILFLRVESTMTMCSAPSLSSKITRWPERDLMTLVKFLPDSLVSGGGCALLHTPPTTIGRSTSPCSNTTSTWSSTSGKT